MLNLVQEIQKRQPYEFADHIHDFAFMPKFADNIDFLSQLAEPEDWDYKNTAQRYSHPVLHSYITYTYKRVAEEKKISITADEEYCCWNSGLITKTQEPIFLVFSKNNLKNTSPY